MDETKRICCQQNYLKIMTERSFLNRREIIQEGTLNIRKQRQWEKVKIWVSTIDIHFFIGFSKIYLLVTDV